MKLPENLSPEKLRDGMKTSLPGRAVLRLLSFVYLGY